MKFPLLNIKSAFSAILIFVALFFVVNDSHATHIVGGDLTYRHVEDDIYEVTLTFRRDCFNAAEDAVFDDPVEIAIYTKEGKLATWVGRFGILEIPLSDSDTLNTTIVSDCGFIGQQVCVEETQYVRNIRLPFRPGGYVLSYQRCCRNMTLNNIIDPLNTGSTYTVCISEEAMAIDNNSPSFKQWPDIYICANEPLIFDHSAIDIDGDSLVYRLCTPYAGASEANPQPLAPAPPYDTVIWQNPFNAIDPLGGTPLSIDSETGELTGTPSMVGQFLVGICVLEYRDGELLSEVRRDFQYNVRVCSEAPEVTFEVEDTICNFTPTFVNNSQGVDTYQWFYDNGDGNLVEFSTEENPSFRFPGPGIYEVTLEGTRSVDGCSSSFTTEVEIPNTNLIADFNVSLSACNANSFTISATDLSSDIADINNEIIERTWIVITDGEEQIFSGEEITFDNVSGEGSISLTVTAANGCVATVEKDFLADELIPDANFEAVVLSCNEDGSVTLSLTDATATDEDIISYAWSIDINGQMQELSGPSVQITVAENDVLDVLYTVTFASDCVSSTSKELAVENLLPSADFDAEIVQCKDDGLVDIMLSRSSEQYNPNSYFWVVDINGESTEYTDEEVLLSDIEDDSNIKVSLTLTFDNGCDAMTMRSFNVQDILPKADFVARPSMCNADGTIDVTLTNASDNLEDIVMANWTIVINGNMLTFSGNEISIEDLSPDDVINVILEVFYDNGCTALITRDVNIADVLPTADFAIAVTSCNEDGTIDIEISNASSNIESIEAETWSITVGDETITSTTSPINIPGLSPDQSINVSLEVSYGNGCNDLVQRDVNLTEVLPVADFEASITSCNDDGTFWLLITDISGTHGEIDDVVFEVTINGQITSYTEPSVEITINEGDDITILQTIQFANGCDAQKEETLDLSEILPSVDFEGKVTSCNADGSLDILLSAIGNGNLVDVDWEISIAGNEITESGQEVTLTDVKADAIIEITLNATFDNGCTASIAKTLEASEFLPEARIEARINACNADGTVDVVLINTSDDLENIVSADWTVTIDGDINNYSGNEVVIGNLSADAVIDATLDVIYNTDCVASASRQINVSALLPEADFAIAVTSCNEDGTIDIEISNASDDLENVTSETWNINIGSTVINAAESPVAVENIAMDQILAVSLEVMYNNGCSASVMREVDPFDFLPQATFSAELSTCNDDGSFTIIIDDTSHENYEVSSLEFSVEINGETSTFTATPFELVINQEDVVVISQLVEFTNGCSAETVDTLNLEELLPQASFDVMVDACNPDGSVDITLINTTSGLDNASVTNWMISINDNPITSSENEVSFTGLGVEDEVNVSLEVLLSNGCDATIDSTFTINDILPKASYEASLIGCQSENILDIRLTNNSLTLAESISWEVTNGTNVTTSTDEFIDITIDRQLLTVVSLDILFNNGCTDILVDTLDINSVLPLPTFSFAIEECVDGTNQALITLTENTEADGNSVAWEWSIVNGSEVITGSEQSISLRIDKDSVLIIDLKVTLDNGCVLILENFEYMPGPFPNVDFINDRIDGCVGDTVTLVSNPNSEWTYTWSPMDGLLFTDDDQSNPQAIIMGIDQEYKVTVSDGSCIDSAMVTIGVDSTTILVFTGDSSSCDGTFTTIATPADGVGRVEWASDRDFTDILSTNDTLRGEQNETTLYYARVIGGTCDHTVDSFSIKSAEIDIVELPFEICQGDTTDLTIFNLDPEQELTFIFEPDSHIVDNGDTGMPIIGIGESEVDSFYLYYMVSNQFGCTKEDSVLVKIVDNPMIDFVATLEECGAFTVCFEITMDYNGIPAWEFGDPGSGFDNRSFEPAPCHTYPGPGDYVVTLSTFSNFCAAEPIEKTITLSEDFTVNPIEDQTLCMGDTLQLTAGASIDGLNYVWCTSAGDTIAIGDTLTYVADNGSVDINLKGFDFFACSDTTMFSINVVDFDLVYDIPEVICNAEETVISVMDTTGRNLQYSWGPASAIVSGGDTNNPTVSISEDTEISLTITDLETSCSFDTSFILMASGLDAGIDADPGTEINEGESVDLNVTTNGNPVDYEWSEPGLDGPDVTVMPSTTTTYSVTVTDDMGCTDVASITIIVREAMCDETDVYIPNAFTPNNDGNNDVFRVRSNFIESMNLVVYNRWGEEVFSTTNPEEGWDGTFNNERLAPDVYGYSLQVICINAVQYNVQGNVSLLR